MRKNLLKNLWKKITLISPYFEVTDCWAVDCTDFSYKSSCLAGEFETPTNTHCRMIKTKQNETNFSTLCLKCHTFLKLAIITYHHPFQIIKCIFYFKFSKQYESQLSIRHPFSYSSFCIRRIHNTFFYVAETILGT